LVLKKNLVHQRRGGEELFSPPTKDLFGEKNGKKGPSPSSTGKRKGGLNAVGEKKRGENVSHNGGTEKRTRSGKGSGRKKKKTTNYSAKKGGETGTNGEIGKRDTRNQRKDLVTHWEFFSVRSG